MIKLASFLLLMSFGSAFAQHKDTQKLIVDPVQEPSPMFKDEKIVTEDNTIFSAAGLDIKPEFPGGMDAFYLEFWKHFKIPNDSLRGKLFITFIIEKDGSLTNLKVLRDIGFNSGSEAIKAIKKLPKWRPASYQGKIVRCLWAMPIPIPYEPTKKNIVEIRDK